jgi:hypothetical protein
MLGIATFIPAIYVVLFSGMVIFGLTTSWEPPPTFVVVMVVAHLACIVLLIGLFIYYALHVSKNDRLTPDQKAIWIALLFIANVVAMPFYWYNYISCPRPVSVSPRSNAHGA